MSNGDNKGYFIGVKNGELVFYSTEDGKLLDITINDFEGITWRPQEQSNPTPLYCLEDILYVLSNTSSINQREIYAIVEYDGKIKPIYFSPQIYKGERWYLESPCELSMVADGEQQINDYISETYVEEFDRSELDDMIIDGKLYEIDCWQVAPFLPKFVSGIKFISEGDIVRWLIERDGVKL